MKDREATACAAERISPEVAEELINRTALTVGFKVIILRDEVAFNNLIDALIRARSGMNPGPPMTYGELVNYLATRPH